MVTSRASASQRCLSCAETDEGAESDEGEEADEGAETDEGAEADDCAKTDACTNIITEIINGITSLSIP